MAPEVVNEEAKGCYSIYSVELDNNPDMEAQRSNRTQLQMRLNQHVSTKLLEEVLSSCDENGNFDYRPQSWIVAQPMLVTSVTYRNMDGERFDFAWPDYVTLGKPDKIQVDLTTRVSVSE